MSDPKSKAFLTKNISSSGKSRSVTSLIGGNRRDEGKEKDKTNGNSSPPSPGVTLTRTGSAPSPVVAKIASQPTRPSSFAMAKPSGQARANVIGNSGFRSSMSPTTGQTIERQIMEAEDNNGGSSPATPPASPDMEEEDNETTSTSSYDPSVYPFSIEDSDQNISFEDKEEGVENIRKVRGATLPKLIERLTYEKYPDPNFLLTFLLTYRSFTTPKEFLALLRQRYNVPIPPNLSGEELENYKKLRVIPVRLRCFNVCKNWVQTHFYDFADHKELCDDFLDFVRNTMKVSPGMASAAEQLERAVQKQLEGIKEEKQVIFNKKPPTPILPTTPPPYKFEDIHVDEIARQTTLIEYELFKAIKPWECLNQAWTKKTTPPKAPNILEMIARFNRVSEWCKTEIVRTENFKARTATIVRFIDLAEKCFQMHNLNATMSILAALQSSSVFRLKPNWAEIPRKQMQSFEEMVQQMSNDRAYASLRAYLKALDPPCIPYLGMYLTDLTFIEDGNPNNIGNGLINFFKRRQISAVIHEIQQCQQTPYCLESVPQIQEYLKNVEVLTEDECYQLSLQHLPRGAPKPVEQQTDAKQVDEFADMILEGYPFAEKDSDKNVLLGPEVEGKPELIAGTLVKLVERLTYDKYTDVSTVDSFLFTFKTFTTADELLNLLIARFRIPVPKNATKEKLARFKASKELPIQLRVMNVLKAWADKYGDDFIENNELTEKVLEFTKTFPEGNNAMTKACTWFKQTLSKLLEQGHKKIGPLTQGVPPPPKITSQELTSTKIQFVDLPAEEIARQLSLIEHRLLASTKPDSFLPRAGLVNPEIAALKQRYITMQNWILTEILNPKTPKERALVITQFIRIANYCKEFKNYNTLVQIITALLLDAARNLSQTWAAISNTTKENFQELVSQVSLLKDYKDYHDKFAKMLEGAALPFIEMYLNKISEIATQPDNMGELINFTKRKNMAAVVFELIQYQHRPFNFQPVPELEQYLLNVSIWDTDIIDEFSMMLKEEEELLHVAKREAAGASAQVYDDTTRLINCLKKVYSDDVSLRNALKAKIKENLSSLSARDNSRLLGELSQELYSCKRDYVKEIVRLNSQSASGNQIRKNANDVIYERFGGQKMTQWKATDDWGVVFGWPDEIVVNVMNKNDAWYLVEQRDSVDHSQLAALLRSAKYYDASPGNAVKKAKLLLLTATISARALQIAKSSGVEVVLVNSV
eukprot:TRINITY_DN9768_c0_g3_i1.p1 TRINITY_DN9768_c0_g3~~TRINITY_DN9768_c0_g3_i1.p1  ORF type:complete len:1216 (+),score=300.44 TRINITY_DN9768_c0_g3_i1:210-3857(+)